MLRICAMVRSWEQSGGYKCANRTRGHHRALPKCSAPWLRGAVNLFGPHWCRGFTNKWLMTTEILVYQSKKVLIVNYFVADVIKKYVVGTSNFVTTWFPNHCTTIVFGLVLIDEIFSTNNNGIGKMRLFGKCVCMLTSHSETIPWKSKYH